MPQKAPSLLSPVLRSGGEGWSFVLDPTYAQPTDPRWLEFCRALTPWALARGARTSPTQVLPQTLLPARAVKSIAIHCQLPYIAKVGSRCNQPAT